MKFSVIVPVYNVEKFLKKCLDSIINQTYSNIEIICVNDGSTDDSLSILEEYKEKDSRITVINQTNQGLVKVRMNALKVCTGDYVMFVDSDDWIEENSLEIIKNKISKYKDVDIVKFRYIIEPHKKKQDSYFGKELIFNNEDMKSIYGQLFMSSKFNNLANQVVKKELFNCVSYDDSHLINQGEDKYINIDLFLNANSILFVEEILYHYFYNQNSISNSVNKNKYIEKFNSLGLLYNKINNNLDKISYDDKVIIKILRYQIKVITKYMEFFLTIEKIKKSDLLDIQNKLINSGFYEKMNALRGKRIYINILHNKIANNIINKKVVDNYKFRYLFSLKRVAKNIYRQVRIKK